MEDGRIGLEDDAYKVQLMQVTSIVSISVQSKDYYKKEENIKTDVENVKVLNLVKKGNKVVLEAFLI